MDVEAFGYKADSSGSSFLGYGGESSASCSQEDQFNFVHAFSPEGVVYFLLENMVANRY